MLCVNYVSIVVLVICQLYLNKCLHKAGGKKTLLNLSWGGHLNSGFPAPAAPRLSPCSFLRRLSLTHGLNCWALTADSVHRGWKSRPGAAAQEADPFRLWSCHLTEFIAFPLWFVAGRKWELQIWFWGPFQPEGSRIHDDTDNSICLLLCDFQTAHILMGSTSLTWELEKPWEGIGVWSLPYTYRTRCANSHKQEVEWQNGDLSTVLAWSSRYFLWISCNCKQKCRRVFNLFLIY